MESADLSQRRARRPARFLRRVLRLTTSLALLSAAAFAGGFAAFVFTLPAPPAEPPAAQGIVVLTGGEMRIDAALDLLAARRGDRLLISGLHAATTKAALVARHPDSRAAFDCCIDLGWEAQDTPGNAAEAARWAMTHGYTSLIVVTASYHMPRALLELGAQMENVALTAYAVQPETLAREDAWTDPATLQLMAGEYMKYVAAQARIGGDRLLSLTGS